MDEEAASISDTETKRPQFQFGTRHLTNPKNVFEHNAWDNVQWGEEQIQLAEEKRKLNSSTYLQEEEASKYEKGASTFWDTFYEMHENKFFKERHWIFIELPELVATRDQSDETTTADATGTTDDYPGSSSKYRVLEVGCGTGSTVFPLLEADSLKHRGGYVYCCDFSPKAVELVKTNHNYDASRCHAFVCDVSTENAEFPFPENSLDIILLIFVMSAISPERIGSTIKQLSRHLKPGGRIFFRDYGQYDMAELRFKPGRCISDHYYVRGDGTRVYFFGQDELREIFQSAGLVEEQNIVDRRLIVNRGRQLTMFRVWIQCKYRKPV